MDRPRPEHVTVDRGAFHSDALYPCGDGRARGTTHPHRPGRAHRPCPPATFGQRQHTLRDHPDGGQYAEGHPPRHAGTVGHDVGHHAAGRRDRHRETSHHHAHPRTYSHHHLRHADGIRARG